MGSCDGPDWADPHTAPACSAASPRDPDEPSPSSNHGVRWPSQRQLRRLKGLPSLPTGMAIGSGEERRKTTNGTKEEDVDNRSLPGVSSGSLGCAEPTAPSADCRPKENRKKPVVPSGDGGDRLRGSRRETLLEMLAEQWEEADNEEKDLLTYTRELRDTLHTVWEEAHSTLREAQVKQKKWYDTKSVLRSLKVGNKALILLPTCDNKLLARWQGPYEVIGQVNRTTYRLALPHSLGREQIYHINLLKKWQDPVDVYPVQFIINVVTDEIPYLSFPTQSSSKDSLPHTNPNLTYAYREQLKQVVEKYRDIFSKHPGRTQLVEHPIRTKNEAIS
ncbi:hypothetical protein NDU88_004808 [Pleurodeles waltl]|uniref:Tf2-1-like SH3-like domain-containing protein n=1 Tax=Pleurodeles waltl TaxID=8319 RepID=A0AAV7T957_PLEWA|nr:hypothetical protein NDU88_004808 [Pleurodeles waltl]